MSQLRNDAVDNLLGALVIAGHYIIPGTLLSVLFHGFLWNRRICCRMLLVFQPHPIQGKQGVKNVVIRSQCLQQSEFSPACEWSATIILTIILHANTRVVGIDILVNWQDVMRQTNLRRFRSHKCKSLGVPFADFTDRSFKVMSPHVG